jgi:hypothetical protein
MRYVVTDGVECKLDHELWDIYAQEFQDRWGIDRKVSLLVGAVGKSVFAAEYKDHGEQTYRDSVILPIRNAFYAASVMEHRWSQFKTMQIVGPILDYGCGVGLQLLYMKRKGFKQLYGFELPGIQHSVMESVFKKEGIGVWNGEPVKTVICMNVLEHVGDPVALLNKLVQTGRVIANICTDRHDSPHVAPEDQLEKCRRILEDQGTLYEAA